MASPLTPLISQRAEIVVFQSNNFSPLKTYIITKHIKLKTILESKEPKIIKHEIAQYNISTKFEFRKNGDTLIGCPQATVE